MVSLTQTVRPGFCSSLDKSIRCLFSLRTSFSSQQRGFLLSEGKNFHHFLFFFKNVNNKKIFSNEALFPLSVGGHKCGLIIRPFFPELIMLTPTITEEEKQTLQSIRPLMPRFLATYFLTA